MSARTLLDGNTFESAVQMMNLSNNRYRIRKGTLFGQAGAVSVVHSPDGVPMENGVPKIVPVESRASSPQNRRKPINDQLVKETTDRSECQSPSPPNMYAGSGQDLRAATQNLPGDSLKHVQCIIDSLPMKLSAEQRKKAEELICDNAELFSKSEFDIGRTSMAKHHIDTGTSLPFKQPLRRHPMAHLPIIDRHVDEMIKAGVVPPTVSEWASNVVLIKKPDQTWRFCVDMRQLNNLTLKDSYPLPRGDTCLESLGGAVYISSLDLRQGYWQQELDEKSSQKAAFVTRRGVFKFNVLAYGLCNAPASFQRLMDMVLNGLTWQFCLVYLDDVVVFSSTFEDHLLRLQQVFDRFRSANLKLKASKCKLFQRQIKFLGNIVSAEGISPDPEK